MLYGASIRRSAAACVVAAILALFGSITPTCAADEAEWKRRFADDIVPILKSRCVECHGSDEPEGGLDLAKFVDGADPLSEMDAWERVGPRIRQNEMPPEGSPGLNDDQKGKFNRWLDTRPRTDDCDQLATDETTSWYRGYVMSRRLTRTEYGNAVRDLFGVDLDAEVDLPTDGAGGEGFDTAGDALFTSPIHLEAYVAAAYRVVRTVLPDSTDGLSPELADARQRLLIASPSETLHARDAARRILSSFAKRAWRRPVEADEIERLLVLFDASVERGESFDRAVRHPLAATLVSPHFLFVVETEPESGGVHRLSPHQLATRVSLFLWSSIPDDRLTELADSGAIHEERTLREEVGRMLADPKSRALGENFGMQWLGLTTLGKSTKPDPEKFPEFDAELAEAMREEPIRLIQRIFAENRSLLELIDADYVVANGRLARHYGAESPAGDDWAFVDAPAGRGGVATTAAVLTATSYPLRTSPVLRGRWALEEILGSRVPPPPPGVPALEETKSEGDEPVSLRERLELHRKDPNCASCHARMDPIGFGLENFDPLGRWREEDGGFAIDAAGKLPSGESFAGPDELKTVLLKRKDEFLKHYVKKTLGFALGRDLNRFDDCVVEAALKRLKEDDYRSQGLIEEIVLSYPFQHRYFEIEVSPGPLERSPHLKETNMTSLQDKLAARRRFLKGASATLALPLFGSLAPKPARGAEAETSPPRRAAFLYFPNGVWEKAWTPEKRGADYDLPFALEPLADVKGEVTVLSGLDKKHSHGGDGHYAKTANFLTGMPVTKTTGKDISSGGISVDQLAAQHLAGRTPLPSLELGTEPVISGIDSNVGYTRLYGSHISWQSPTRPVAKEINPRVVYERLFGKGLSASENPESYDNLLDYVLEDARRLRGRLGRDDQFKMDEYLDSVRAVEKRIEFATRNAGRESDPALDPARLAQRRPGVPGDFREHVDVMLDLMALAFQTDATRVGSFMFANDVSGRNFSFLDGVRGGHHEMSHHENNDEKIEQYKRINRWHVEQFAKLVGKLRSVKEGDGTLLDNCMILMGSSISDGNRHDPDNLPLLLAGRGGGAIAPGRHLAAEGSVPLCNLYLSMLRGLDMEIEAFGDSSGPLQDLAGVG